MSTDRDVTRIVRSWLREDRHEDAERVLNSVLTELDTTSQRRSWWSAWRRPDMNAYLRLGLAAAAILVAAFIGYQIFSGSNVGGPPAPSPSVAPSQAPAETPTTTPAPVFLPAGELAIGRHHVTIDGVSFSFEVPTSGWFSNPVGSAESIQRGADNATTPAWMLFWSPNNVYSDPCAHTRLSPPVGPSAANLAAALLTMPGTDATEPTDVTVGGRASNPEPRTRAAIYVELTVREDVGCAAEDFYLWVKEGVGEGPRHASDLPTTIRVWIVDVDGGRLVIESELLPGSTPELDQEIDQIVDSIQFE